MKNFLKLVDSIIALIIFNLLAIGWTYIRDRSVTSDGLEHTIVLILVVLVITDLVDRKWSKK